VLLSGCDYWTTFRQGPDRTGFNPFDSALDQSNVADLVQAWAVPLGGPVGDPVALPGIVYAAVNGSNGSPGTVYARDASSGASRWSVTVPGGCGDDGTCVSPSLAPVASGKKLFVGRLLGSAGLGSLDAYNAQTGALEWSSSFGAAIGPAVSDDKVYAVSMSTPLVLRVAVYDVKTGAVLFVTDSGASEQLMTLAVANGRIYSMQDHDLKVYDAAGAVNCSGGPPKVCMPLWRSSLPARSFSTPAVTGDLAYVGAEDGKLYAFDASGCGESFCTSLWSAQTGAAIERSSAAVAYGLVYVGSNDGNVYAFDAAGCGHPTCAARWTGTTGAAVVSSPSVADGVVFVGSNDKNVYAFRADGCGNPTCNAMWSATTGGVVSTSPAITGGRVLVGSNDGTLYAYELP
jgi:outer membrane protein assembly factor BamB